MIRNSLNDAVAWGKLARNPATGRRISPKVPRRKLTESPWTPAQVGQFLRHVESDRLFAAYRLIATTGLRKAELLGLRRQDLDLETGALSIGQTLTTVGHRIVIQESAKTDESARRIMLDEATLAALRRHLVCQSQERLQFGPAYQDHGLLFCREDGAPLHPGMFLRTFQRRSREAGLPLIRLHDLRHSWATHALLAGVGLATVSARLGHSSIRTTADIYGHFSQELDRDAAEKVAALLD